MLFQRNPMSVGKRPVVHEGHAGPLIQVLTWLFLAFSSLSIIAHFATKKALSRPFTGADSILLAALVSTRSESFAIVHVTHPSQVLSTGQAAAFLSPNGQLIENSQSGLSEVNVMQAWKVNRSTSPQR
jgi:hypothetical protein